MKDHYDFSNGKRGQFYSTDAVFRIPAYLDEAVQPHLTECAASKSIELSDLVNDLLKKDIELIEAAK